MGSQGSDLVLDRRMHPEVVQAAFPHTDHARIVEQLFDPGGGLGVEGAGVVGMHAGRGENAEDRIRQLQALTAGFDVDPDTDDAFDAGGFGSLDHCWRFEVQEE